MKKNDSIELVIEDMGTDGEGIGHVATEDGRSIAVFVKDAVMGDTIRAANHEGQKAVCVCAVGGGN